MDKVQLESFFHEQRASLNYFFDQIDLDGAVSFLNKLAQISGTIFFTGVGKSGFIAQKMTASFVSMGIKSHFLSPQDALHGDLGIVHSEDMVIFLSKSGESAELLALVPFIRNRGVEMVALVSNPQSGLAKAADFMVHLPMDKELCPYNIVPTTSTEIQLIYGDILAVALMKKKKLSLDEFALNHPGGKIGKRLSLKVEELMIRGDHLPLAYQNETLVEALEELSSKKCGCLLIMDHEKKLQGIFTDGDLRRALQKFGGQIFELTLKELQKFHPKTIQPGKFVWEAMRIMEYDQKHPFMVLPVVDDQGVIQGLLKMHDILQSGIV